MKILVVEDDFLSRKLLNFTLSKYGDCDIAVNGVEAVNAVKLTLNAGSRYDLICLDIMMPIMDGREALTEIRKLEEKSGILLGHGAKIFMITALGDHENIIESFKGQCDDYLVKPVKRELLIEMLGKHELIK